MKIKTMRAIDRFAGVPLCWLTGAWNSLRCRRAAAANSPINTVLVVKLFGLGSVLLSTPVLLLLQERLPHARILYLTFASNRAVLEKTGLPIEIITISNTSLWAFFVSTATALRRLMSASIDAVFDLEYFSKFSTLVSVVCGAPLRVGFDLPVRWRRSNLTHLTPMGHIDHVSRLFVRQLEAIGIGTPKEIRVIGLRASPEERTSMERKLDLAGDGSEVICININAGSTSLDRRWRPQRFVEVARRLMLEESSRRIYFIGDSGERPYVEAALQSSVHDNRGLHNCSGELRLGELVALLERSSFLLTNDSGPMHIAAAAGTPVVALFGPESPAIYGPIGRSQTCYKALACSPCLNVYNAKQFICPYNTRCMEEISTREVLESIQHLAPNVRVSDP